MFQAVCIADLTEVFDRGKTEYFRSLKVMITPTVLLCISSRFCHAYGICRSVMSFLSLLASYVPGTLLKKSFPDTCFVEQVVEIRINSLSSNLLIKNASLILYWTINGTKSTKHRKVSWLACRRPWPLWSSARHGTHAALGQQSKRLLVAVRPAVTLSCILHWLPVLLIVIDKTRFLSSNKFVTGF